MQHDILGEILPAQPTPLVEAEALSAGRAVMGRLGAVGRCSCSWQAPVLLGAGHSCSLMWC